MNCCWIVLPMGLASAPGLMQMVMQAIVNLFTDGPDPVRARVYLDDFLFTAPHPKYLHHIPAQLEAWGLSINRAKSHLDATQHLT